MDIREISYIIAIAAFARKRHLVTPAQRVCKRRPHTRQLLDIIQKY